MSESQTQRLPFHIDVLRLIEESKDDKQTLQIISKMCTEKQKYLEDFDYDLIRFGKYKEQRFSEIVKKDKNYLEWAVKNVKLFRPQKEYLTKLLEV